MSDCRSEELLNNNYVFFFFFQFFFIFFEIGDGDGRWEMRIKKMRKERKKTQDK